VHAVERAAALRALFRTGAGGPADVAELYAIERRIEELVARAVASDEITAPRQPQASLRAAAGTGGNNF
jgi:hypothetical protein